MQPVLTIAPFTTDDAADAVTVARLTELINEVYAEGERGLWFPGQSRTTVGEVANFARAGELWVARLDDELVGAIRLCRLDDTTSEFGMLVASGKHRGLGVGRELVRFAEANARAAGDTTMQLEVLTPRDWTHPVKRFLVDWYTRLGYVNVRTEDFAPAYPHLSPFLATPCDFRIFQKKL